MSSSRISRRSPLPEERTIAQLPNAIDRADGIRQRLERNQPAVFLDYDGTLTPIVDDPEDATLPPAAREAIVRLSQLCTVAVVSGRDLDDVRGMVDIPGIHYAGSHGFDILTPDGESIQKGREFLPSLDEAERELATRMEHIGGARIERKRFAIAVHYRQVDDTDVPDVEAAVDAAMADHDDLRRTGGKRIYELRPDIEWHKGEALRFLLETLDLDQAGVVPMYLGDDVTDEDAFRAIADDGLGLVVRGEDDQRTTAADYAFDDTEEVRAFLVELANRLEAGS
ncbi:MAG: trehalose-phosphatase [Actinobacteria bacterium]|nr:trehalose-phosphatase [Actinomycetota bacterium]